MNLIFSWWHPSCTVQCPISSSRIAAPASEVANERPRAMTQQLGIIMKINYDLTCKCPKIAVLWPLANRGGIPLNISWDVIEWNKSESLCLIEFFHCSPGLGLMVMEAVKVAHFSQWRAMTNFPASVLWVLGSDLESEYHKAMWFTFVLLALCPVWCSSLKTLAKSQGDDIRLQRRLQSHAVKVRNAFVSKTDIKHQVNGSELAGGLTDTLTYGCTPPPLCCPSNSA